MSTSPSYTVLNVDDNDAVRYARSKILEPAGYRVIEASTGSEALTLARREQPALLVLDVKLPDISGLDVCQQMKNDPQTAAILVLQISAHYTSCDDRTVGLEYADSYLVEPVTPQEFLASVQALLRLHAREDEYRRLLREVSTADLEKRILGTGQYQTTAQEEVRRLTAQLGAVKEHEREKLAQSLHDDLAQMLVVARMKLHQERHRPALATVKEIDTVLEQCLTYTRSLMSDLLPPQLYDGRLDVALRWISDSMRKHGLTVVVRVPEHTILAPESTAMTILKCARELLFNVLKHAGTGEAFLTLMIGEGVIRVTVQDHGKGWDATSLKVATPHSFGLASVHQRLELLGGKLELESQPGMGMRATVIVPYRPLA
ncbi:MAG: response regulator [Nitrospira sp.]